MVLGLCDPDPQVRQATSDSIVDTFRPDEIVETVSKFDVQYGGDP